MNLIITQNWNDERLQFNRSIFPFKHLSFSNESRIWVPILYVANEANLPGINTEHQTYDRPSQFITIEPNGMSLLYITYDLNLRQIIFAL